MTFIAHRDTITAELNAGWPMKAVYEKLADKLGISYPQFARYVHVLIRHPGLSEAPRPASTARSAQPSPAALTPPPKPLPQPIQEGQQAHARHEPAARRAFNHDAIERPDDRKRLLGED